MKILVGMDLASQGIRYHALDEMGRTCGSGPLPWSREAWAERMQEWEGAEHVTVAFETGPEAYRAQALCLALGAETYPFHAAHFAGVTRSKKKTDRIDAKKIAQALRSDGLPRRVALPCAAIAALRNLVSEREQYLKIIRQVQNRARGLARQWGLDLPAYSHRHRQQWWDDALEAVGRPHRDTFARMATIALAALQSLERVEEAMEEQVTKAGLENAVELLDSLPGFGRLIAICVAAFLCDGSRFSSGRKAASYVGLVPWVSQTGECKSDERILGHITKEGPPILRRLLIQAAQAAANGNQLKRTRWHAWFSALRRRRGRRIAVVALARKLMVTSHALLRDGVCWDPEVLRPTAA